jgi:type IV pilus assembly protein PilA
MIKTKSGLPAQTGFTLLEILLVVAAIGILAAITIVAINPTKQLGETKNAQRRSDVATILNAVYQYSIDNNGVLPAGITTNGLNICKTGTPPATCASLGGIDLSVLTTDEVYLVAMPQDPTGSIGTDTTGYFIKKNVANRINVTAVHAEQNEIISVTK